MEPIAAHLGDLGRVVDADPVRARTILKRHLGTVLLRLERKGFERRCLLKGELGVRASIPLKRDFKARARRGRAARRSASGGTGALPEQ